MILSVLAGAAASAIVGACGGETLTFPPDEPDASRVDSSVPDGPSTDASVAPDSEPAHEAAAPDGGAPDASAVDGSDGSVQDATNSDAPAPVAERIATGAGNIVVHLEASDSRVYVKATNSELRSVPVTGGPLVLEAAGVGDFTLVTDGVVYVAWNAGTATIRHRTTAGVEKVVATLPANAVAVGSRGGDFAYAWQQLDAGGVTGGVELRPKGAPALTRPLSGRYPSQLLLDDANAYVVDYDGFSVVPRNGGSIAQRGGDAGFYATGQERGFAQDESALYFRGGTDPNGRSALRRALKAGGAAVDLTMPEADQAPLHHLALEGDYVYFACNTFPLRRVHRAGGAFETVDPEPVSATGSDYAVAVNATHVFWANAHGEIWRRLK